MKISEKCIFSRFILIHERIELFLQPIGEYHTDKSKLVRIRKKHIFCMSVEDLHSISLKWKFAKIIRQIAFKMTASI